MARVIFGQGVSSVLGKIGGTIFQRGPYGGIARNWEHKSNSRTPAQTRNRTAHGIILSSWRSLSSELQSGWNAYAGTQSPVSKGQAPYFLSGQQQYYRVAHRRWSAGIPQSYWSTIPATNGWSSYVWDFAEFITSLGGSVLAGELNALNTFAERLWSRDKFDSVPLMWIPVGDTLGAALGCFAGSFPFEYTLENHGFNQSNWLGSGFGYGLEAPTHDRYLSVHDFSLFADPPTSFHISFSHFANYPDFQTLFGSWNGLDVTILRSSPMLADGIGISGDTDTVTLSPFPTSGSILISRPTIGTLGLYLNGYLQDDLAGLLVCNYPPEDPYLFAQNQIGAPQNLSSVRIAGFCISQYDNLADTLSFDGYFRDLMSSLASLH